MKKSIICILCIGVLFANDLPLSEQKTELLRLKREKIEKDAEIQKRSWVSPLIFSLSANKSKGTTDLQSNTNTAAVEWSQDLFRSGGIYYTIEQADALRETNLIGIDREEAGYLKQVYTLAAQIQRDTLKRKQNELTLQNRDIDLFIIKAKYKIGSTDISELNRVTIDRDNARTALIVIKNTLRNEVYELKKLIGQQSSDSLRLPDIPLISKNQYLKQQLELLQYEAQDKSDNAALKITRTAYLPRLTFNGSYGYNDYQSDLIDYSGDTYRYGAVLSIPLDINTKATVESSRLQLLQTRTAGLDRRLELEQEYDKRLFTISDYEEKITVAEEMIAMYDELYGFTDNQVKAGFKSAYELESLGNSVQIQKYEKEIQRYNIEIEKIALYFDTKQ
jgi:outer membrane protein TolC